MDKNKIHEVKPDSHEMRLGGQNRSRGYRCWNIGSPVVAPPMAIITTFVAGHTIGAGGTIVAGGVTLSVIGLSMMTSED